MNAGYTVLETRGAAAKLFELVIEGEAIAQNGWKMAFRGRRTPYIFDPLSKEKKTLKKKIKEAIQPYNVVTPLFKNTFLKVQVSFFLKRATSKDLDNMAKFLLDSLEGAAYDNDKHIVDLHLVKSTLNSPKTIITISSI